MFQVNFLAVAVAALTFFVGGLWYAPGVFGRTWAREAGVQLPDGPPQPGARKGKHAGAVFAFALLFAFVGAWTVAWVLGPGPTVAAGWRVGLALGGGVAATSLGINYQFAARSWRLLAIDAGYHTLKFTLFGVVVGAFG